MSILNKREKVMRVIIMNISNSNIIDESSKKVELYNHKQITQEIEMDALKIYTNSNGKTKLNLLKNRII